MKYKNYCFSIVVFLVLSLSILGFNKLIMNNEYTLEKKTPQSSSYYYDIHYLELNNTLFYMNETIGINASWDLSQEGAPFPDGRAFMQIQIYNNNTLLWESEEFEEIGENIQHDFSILVSDLINDSAELVVTIFHYKEEDWGSSISRFYLNNKSIYILKYGQINNLNLEINSSVLFLDEIFLLNLSWDLLYTNEYENSYIQIQIYNSTNELIWNSSKIVKRGVNLTRCFNISISDLNTCWNKPQDTLSIYCFYYYESLIRPILTEKYFLNQTIIILECGRVKDISLRVNQDILDYDQNIIINASWSMQYEAVYENSYIQIQIYNSTNELIWNSSKIFERGMNLNRCFNISISDLNICWNKPQDTLFIRFYYYYKSLIRPILTEKYHSNYTIIIGEIDSSSKIGFKQNGFLILTISSAISSSCLFSVILASLTLLKKKKKYVKDIVIEY
ncbi:MAG: hypothetical protein EU547_00005 [Promethearchaeota archaeon]|nr:MAG: hypothetical protein EU547_00005 [Candidatus Lokiarchaeota archaeon]